MIPPQHKDRMEERKKPQSTIDVKRIAMHRAVKSIILNAYEPKDINAAGELVDYIEQLCTVAVKEALAKDRKNIAENLRKIQLRPTAVRFKEIDLLIASLSNQ